jgi:hypothetical protein
VSDKFPLKYAGAPSRFEGRTVVPPGQARLQIVAADPVGNTGMDTRDLTIGP